MVLLLVSFISGFLTVLAPCILPVIPVVLGSSAARRSAWTPYIVVFSLCVSILVFTLLLKVSTTCVSVHPAVWTFTSGGILAFFGFTLLFPGWWAHIPGVAALSRKANILVGTNLFSHTVWGDILVGAALGPVFSTCSPTYFVILATVLPVSVVLGTLYIFAYVIGLAAALLIIIFVGERIMDKLSILSNEDGYFKKGLGIFFILLGLAIVSGFDKTIETALMQSDFFNVTRVEQTLLNYFNI
jgi:cytochrome c-type biogenesis protein